MKFTRAELEAIHSATVHEAAYLDAQKRSSKSAAARKFWHGERDKLASANRKLGSMIKARR